MKIKTIPHIKRIWKLITIVVLAMVFGAFSGADRAESSCIALDDVPLDVQEQQAPGIVMFVLDDSGSMDWEYVVQGASSALFTVGNNQYYYVFSDPGDNVYSSSRVDNNYILEGSSNANRWKARWSGHNRLYYDPTAHYAPWPRRPDADPDNPRSHPMVSGRTLNLSAVYDNFAGIANEDIEAAGGTIVDNSNVYVDTVSTNQILDAGGVIVDNRDTAGEFAGAIIADNTPASSSPGTNYSETGNWRDVSTGYGTNSRETNQDNATLTATWNFSGLTAGNYDVYVRYVATSDQQGTSVPYTITHSSGTTTVNVNQTINRNQWVRIAPNVNFNGAASVRLSHYQTATGFLWWITRTRASADAVMLVPKFSVGVSDIVFEAGAGWSSSSDGNQYGPDFLYSNGGNRTYTATWTANNLNSTAAYDVYARWAGSSSSRLTNVGYSTTHDGGVSTTAVNQRQNLGIWIKIADNVSFSSGTGRVDINQYTGNNGLCADAVAFMPRTGDLPNAVFEAGAGWSSSSDGNQYGENYLYSDNGSRTYTATWFANNLDTSRNYDVFARWTGGGSSRLTNVVYYITHDGGVTGTGVNQRENHGVWTKIADNVSFSSGTGRVDINQNAGTSGLCADAVAFAPHGTVGPIIIGRAHYYVQNFSGTFLVNLYGGQIEYYRLNDTNNNERVDATELVRLTGTQPEDFGLVTDRTYAEERQNFANWYSFYRKRELTAANAIAKVIDEMEGVYIGISGINRGIISIARPVRVTLNDVDYDQSGDLLSALYGITISAQGTPLRNGLYNAGQYFRGVGASTHIASATPSGYFNTSSYPYFLPEHGGSCQQSFAIVMTDGYWNGSHSIVGNADANTSNPFDGPPFSDSYPNTLADVAMYFYKNDLNSFLNNDVPINNLDQADHQHLVTYSLSFGVWGTINRNNYPDCPLGNCPSWPEPSGDAQTTVDDLWHASVNGRGKYVDASSPMEMVDAMNELKQDIQSRLGSSASLATSSIQRTVDTTIYQGTYNTAGWFGEVSAIRVNVETGEIGGLLWRASNHVPTHANRNIISFDGSSTIDFTYNDLTSPQRALLGNNGHNVAHLVDFIRGDTSRNLSNGGPFRVRFNPIGDIVHSAPTYYKGVVYIGANDGMLHAINATNGHEIFCYVPNMVYGHLSELALPGYSHKYYVDNTPVVGRVGSSDILICGLGKGGKGYFGLNVTTPSSPSALWEYTNDNDLGYSFSEARLVTTAAEGRAVIFGNGYGSVNQNAVLFILNPTTGALIKKIDTQVGGCNGLASPTVVDITGDGIADFVFAGDLKGNMWKFDIRGPATNWRVYHGGNSPQPLVSVRNSDGDVQPITTAPEVMRDCAKSPFADTGEGMMIIFGTGRYLNSDDFADITTQSFYGIWDWSDIWESLDGYGYETAKTKYLGTVQDDRSLSNIADASLQEQTVASRSDIWLTLTDNPLEWYNPVADTGEHMGWVFDLPAAGERGIRTPTLRMGVAVMTSIIPSDSPCEAGGSSVVYQMNACTGGRTSAPQFDVNDDGIIDENDVIDDLPPTGKEFRQMLYPPIEIGLRDLYFSDSEGGIPQLQVPEKRLGIHFWRVVD